MLTTNQLLKLDGSKDFFINAVCPQAFQQRPHLIDYQDCLDYVNLVYKKKTDWDLIILNPKKYYLDQYANWILNSEIYKIVSKFKQPTFTENFQMLFFDPQILIYCFLIIVFGFGVKTIIYLIRGF